jgi:hypothetical protein
MPSSLRRLLIRIARAVLQDVMSQTTQQFNVVENEVQRQMQNHISEVLGGVWTGNGADRFVASINEEAMPVVSEITGSLTNTNVNVQTALEIMDNADQKVRQMVDNLANTFEQI